MSSCCIVQCRAKKTNKQPLLTFHRFPRNEICKRKWYEAIGEENIANRKTSSLYICSLHFPESSFNRTMDVVRLREDVVPSLLLPKPLRRNNPDPVREDDNNVQIKAPTISSAGHEKSQQKNVPLANDDNKVQIEAPTNSSSGQDIFLTKEVSPQILEVLQAVKQEIHKSMPSNQEIIVKIEGPFKAKRKKIHSVEFLQKRYAMLQKKVKYLNDKVRRQDKKIESLEKTIQEMERQEKITKEKFNEEAVLLKDCPGSVLFKRQLTKAKGLPQEKSYSGEVRKFAVTLNSLSPTVYNYMRQEFEMCLPHPRTLRKWGYKKKAVSEVGLANVEMGCTSEALVTQESNQDLALSNWVAVKSVIGINNADDGTPPCNEPKTAKIITNKHLVKFPVPCEACGVDMYSFLQYRLHFLKFHPDRERTFKKSQFYSHMCDQCGRKFSAGWLLKDHLLTHGSETNFECPKCDKTYKSKTQLDMHKFASHSAPVKCHICGILTKKIYLKRHIMIKHAEGKNRPKSLVEFPVPCEACGVGINSFIQYRLHFIKAHPDMERKFKKSQFYSHMCAQCGKKFGSKGVLKDHLLTHGSESNMGCPKCEKAFKSKQQLDAHISQCNEIINCHICGQQITKRNLKRHILVKHTDVKKIECKLCGKSFKTSAEVKNHTRHVHMNVPWPKKRSPTDGQPVQKRQHVKEDVQIINNCELNET